MRCVFDTNVLVSALLVPGSRPRQAFDLALRSARVLISPPVLAELYEVLNRRTIRRYVREETIHNFLAALSRDGDWIEVDTKLSVCRDPKDNQFLELAVSGRATHIITGDADLLVLSPFQGIAIMTPGEFVQQCGTG